MPSFRLSVLFLLAAATGCSAGNSSGTFSTTSTGAGGSGGSGSTSTTATSSTGDQGVGGSFTTGVGGSGTGGGEPQIAEVFGQSPNTLYRLDPTNNGVTTIGNFNGCPGGVIDIALDKDSNLYGTATGSLFTIDKATAKCTLIASGSYPNSLSFVPAGTVDPNKEALVGYLGAQYIRIDPQTGKVTTIGQLSGGYTSSGDIVSVKDGKTFLTANGANCTNGDCLLEINPKTGDLVKNWGDIGFNAVFGVAFWAGKVYGFTDAGELFEITFTGNSITSTKISIPGNPKLQFWGAGSTTSAPVDPIPT